MGHTVLAVSRTKLSPDGCVAPLSIEYLETGLRIMSEGQTDLNDFWDENVDAFRQTVFLAIRETSNALLSSTLPACWRSELEAQLEQLIKYVALADRYIERRCLSLGPRVPELPPAGNRRH